MSATNFGFISGHLARAPKVFENKDGSKKVLFTVANNYGRGDKAGTNFVEVEGFVSKDVKGPGLSATLPKGSRVQIRYELRSSVYEASNGETRYEQRAVIADFFNDIEIVDTKDETAARRAKEATDAQAAQNQAPAQGQGQFVQGQPMMAPQGQFVQGYPAQPMMAPQGGFVAQPQAQGYGYAQNGQFVPGNFAS